MANAETVIHLVMIFMPIIIGLMFLQLVNRAVKNPNRTSQSISSAITRTMSCTAIGISYHVIATSLANGVLRDLGSATSIELWRVEVMFLATLLPAVYLLARESKALRKPTVPAVAE